MTPPLFPGRVGASSRKVHTAERSPCERANSTGTHNKRRVPDVHSVKAPERDRESPLRNRRGHKWRADAVTVRETFTLRFP